MLTDLLKRLNQHLFEFSQRSFLDWLAVLRCMVAAPCVGLHQQKHYCKTYAPSREMLSLFLALWPTKKATKKICFMGIVWYFISSNVYCSSSFGNISSQLFDTSFLETSSWTPHCATSLSIETPSIFLPLSNCIGNLPGLFLLSALF